MTTTIGLSAIVLICLYITKTDQCENGVCFTWNVSVEQLTLICRVGKLGHRVKIVDPFGNIRAMCVPPFPREHCESLYKNGTVRQNVQTNETFYTIHERIDYHVNGKWICIHGTGIGTAVVEVTVLMVKEVENVTRVQYLPTEDQSGKDQCLKDSLLFSMVGFLPTAAISVLITSVIGIDFTCIDARIRNKGTCSCMSAKMISGTKKALFLVTAMLFFATVYITALHDAHCHSKWVFFACSFVISFLSSIVFLSTDVRTTDNGGQLAPSIDNDEEESGQL